MANLPRFGRAWNRFSSVPRPATATQPAYESEQMVRETEIPPSVAERTLTTQPFEPNPPPKHTSLPSSPVRESPWLSSPAKKALSPPSSPKYKPTTTHVASPPRIKSAQSPPSPAHRRYDGGHRISPTTSPKTTHKTSSPPSYRHYDGGRRISPTTSPKTTNKTSSPSSSYRHYEVGRRISPNASPKTTTKTSPPPSYRQPPAPLSPLTLPRPAAQTTIRSRSPPEVEHKSVLYNETTKKEAKSDHQLDHGFGKPSHKQQQQQQPEAINVTAHNVGAVMEIKQSSEKGVETIRKKETEGIGYGNDERKIEAGKERSEKAKKPLATAFMNSNFQSVNNSVLYDSSCNHRDPGLHLSFAEKTKEDGSIVDGNKDYYKF